MKKLLAFVLLGAAFGFIFSSCSKDDDESIAQDQIVGTWEGTSAYVDGVWIDITKYPYSSSLGFSVTFYDDGSYYSRGAFGTGRGTYKISGKTIYSYVSGKLSMTYKIKYMTDTSAEVTLVDGSSTLDVRVRKTN